MALSLSQATRLFFQWQNMRIHLKHWETGSDWHPAGHRRANAVQDTQATPKPHRKIIKFSRDENIQLLYRFPHLSSRTQAQSPGKQCAPYSRLPSERRRSCQAAAAGGQGPAGVPRRAGPQRPAGTRPPARPAPRTRPPTAAPPHANAQLEKGYQVFGETITSQFTLNGFVWAEWRGLGLPGDARAFYVNPAHTWPIFCCSERTVTIYLIQTRQLLGCIWTS